MNENTNISNDLLSVKAPTIPKSHADFARELASLADKYGMDKFTMTYRPKFDHGSKNELDRRINGEMKINYSSVDGRGRPCRNLQVRCDASFSIQVEENQASYG